MTTTTTTTQTDYPYTISVRGSRPVAARKDGCYYWTRHQVQLGIVWHKRDVEVLSGPTSR